MARKQFGIKLKTKSVNTKLEGMSINVILDSRI